MDIERLQQWLNELELDEERRRTIEEKLDQLRSDLEKFKSIRLEEYELPERREVVGWINEGCKPGVLLEVENMSRSGPFYHITGIVGEDFSIMEPRVRYYMSIYLVYPRYYPFPSFYVYVEDLGRGRDRDNHSYIFI